MSDDSRPRGPELAAAVLLVLTVLVGGAVTFPGFVARHVAPRMLYFPGRLPADRSAPQAYGVAGEEAWIRTEDGVRLHAWWIPPADTPLRATVLFLHGNAGHLAGRAFLARRMAEGGYGALLLDYRGFGRSEGTPDEEGLYADARAAHRHLLRDRDVPVGRLVVAGHSLGAAVAARLAAGRPTAGVILTGAFSSVPELGSRIYGWLPDAVFRGWPTQRFETLEPAAGLEVPALVARGARDHLVPRDETRAVYEALPGPAAWYEASAAGHGDLWADDDFWEVLERFLEETVRRR